MDYNDFMKSKHIAERWGEFQANYKNLNKTSELKAYHDLLTEFYDYIQSLEAHLFNDEKVADQKNLLTEYNRQLTLQSVSKSLALKQLHRILYTVCKVGLKGE